MNLEAWEPPDPPDVADAVIARMHASTPAEPEPPSRRRWWWLALPAAAAAAAVLLAVFTTRDDAAPADGAISADRARHVDLGDTAADLEPGASLRWHRDRDGLRVDQQGTATWTTSDRLRISAGASRIDAENANLRVELQMNRQDAAIVATSAITAAAVSLLTITVYSGTVRATSAGATTPVPAGTTVSIPPPPPRIDQTVEPAKIEPAKIELDCDAAALKARGESELANGDYAAAMHTFHSAYACTPETYLLLREYLAACGASNVREARRVFAALPPSQQESTQILQICLKNSIDPRPPQVAQVADATLDISSTPSGANILIDGKDTGEHTPASLRVAAGKHKITLVVGGDRFTWSVKAAAGETIRFAKQLQ